jgi:hypothetical protein
MTDSHSIQRRELAARLRGWAKAEYAEGQDSELIKILCEVADKLDPLRAGVVEGEIPVLHGLLDLCLGIIQEANKHYPASGEFSEDMRLASGQLKIALSPPIGEGE